MVGWTDGLLELTSGFQPLPLAGCVTSDESLQPRSLKWELQCLNITCPEGYSERNTNHLGKILARCLARGTWNGTGPQ